MTALVTDTLPSSIADRLTPEQRQAVAEASREKRLEVLTAALALPEPDALKLLADAAGLDIALNLETDPDARGILPAWLVYDYQFIPIRYGTATDDRPTPEALLKLPTPVVLPCCNAIRRRPSLSSRWRRT